MQAKLKDIAGKAALTARKFGAGDARIKVSHQRYIYLQRCERMLEQIEESTTMSLSAALFVDGRYSGHSTSDLRPDALELFLENAVAMTRCLAPDPHRSLPPPGLYEGYRKRDLEVLDRSYDRTDTEWRKEIALRLEEEAAKGGDKLSQIEAYYYDSINESVLVNTNGFMGDWESTSFWFGASLTAKDGKDAKASYHQSAGNRFSRKLPLPEETAAKALGRVLMMVGAGPMKTQKLPMIIENRAARRLIDRLIPAMSGQSLQQRRSFLEGKEGHQIAAPVLTMIDDPAIPGGLGSRLYDGEGIPSRRRVMIEKGVLREFWIDVYYANKLGRQPTTGGYSNLIFEPGETDAAGLMKKADRGILVTGFLGGNSNTTTGDFSMGILGFHFENGRIVRPVKEMNIADNHLRFWSRLIEVGNDPYPYSSLMSPSLMFEDMLFSGV